jgi:hypothetical protein
MQAEALGPSDLPSNALGIPSVKREALGHSGLLCHRHNIKTSRVPVLN